MSFGKFEFEMPVVPEHCRGCATQCELHTQLLATLIGKSLADRAAEGLTGEQGEAFDALIDEVAELPEETRDQAKHAFRQMVSNSLDTTDKNIERARQTIDANALSCSGVLKMRATKGDVTYTVNVCTSPLQYLRDGEPKHMPVHIKADSANKQ